MQVIEQAAAGPFGHPLTRARRRIGDIFILLFLIQASVSASGGLEPSLVHIETASGKLRLRLLEAICRDCFVLDDGKVIQVRKLVKAGPVSLSDASREEARGSAEQGEWKWMVDEDGLRRRGLRYVATTIAEVIGDYEYAIQHVTMSAYAETARSNYILVIPWDKSRVSGSWVEGLARPCGTRGYPLGDGVMKQKDAFEMVHTRSLDSASFVQSLKEGQSYQCLVPTEAKCPECKGKGRVRCDRWIGSQKLLDIPCKTCASTGKIKKLVPYIVTW